MDKIQITLTTPVTSQEDQTPTPTKFLKQCEDIGLFNDLQRVNPFDETFKKAIDTQYSLLKYPLTVPNPDETLNTPTPFQIGSIDGSKANNVSEDLSLALGKEALDLTDKPLELSDKSSSPSLRSPFVSAEMLPDENSNISMKSNVSSVSIRSPINYSVDTDRGPLNGSSSEERRFMSDVMKSLKTEDSSKFVPIKSKQLNSTSESIKKFILNKKKNRNILNVENKNTSNEIILDSENAYDILKRTSRVNDPLYVHSVSPIQLHALKNENEGFDSMVEKLGALNSIKSFQSPPSKLLALLPSNGLDLTAIPSVPEIEITPIPSPGSEKLPIPRKQEETPVPLVKKKTRELTKEEKRQQILERNRLAAKRSRERQKVHQHALELRLKEKEKECKQLKLEIRNLKMKLLSKEQDIDNLAHIKAQEMLNRALGNT